MDKIIIIDASGSMEEEGKKSVVRYLIQAINGIMGERYSDMKHEMLCWNDQIFPYDSKAEFKGVAEAKALENFLGEHQKDVILLIGDGSYSDDVKRTIKSAESKLLYLMVGNDCNRSRLIKLVCAEDLYEAVDVVTCIDDFMNNT